MPSVSEQFFSVMFNFFVRLSIYLNTVLSLFGLKLIRNKDPLFYNLCEDKNLNPVSILYSSGNQDILLRVPMQLGRTHRWFDLSNASLDPPLAALKFAQKNQIHERELHIFLLKLFETQRDLVNPLNAFSAVGLSENKESKLSKYPAWSLVLPWESQDIEHKFDAFPVAVKQDRLKSGFKIDSDDPVEIMEQDRLNSIDSHVKQFTKLLDSIGKNGLLQGSKNGYISALILIDGNHWRWIIGGEGNHRAIVASFLGHNEIDVLVEGVIRKEDSKYWPNVCNGLYTVSEAEQVFESIFDAKPSFIYNPWLDYFKNKLIS